MSLLEEINLTFSFDKCIPLPENITEYSLSKHTVYIQPECARWCIIPKGSQTEAFELLRQNLSLGDAIKKLGKATGLPRQRAEEVFQEVLVEIDDKRFYKEESTESVCWYEELKLYLTQGCNLRCRHCYKFSGKPHHVELTADEINRLLHEHRDLGGSSLLITGGEPLLRRNVLIDVLRNAKKLGLKTVLLTNGTLLSTNDSVWIGEYLDEIQISLDGPSPNAADFVRGSGNFASVMKAINLVSQSGTKIFLAMTPILETIEEFETKLPEFVRQMSMSYGKILSFRISKAIESGRSVKKPPAEIAREFEKRVLGLEANALGKGYGEQIDAAFYDPGVPMITCGIGLTLGVEADGSVFPCDLSNDSVVANIKYDSLEIIRERLLQIAKQNSVDLSPACSECSLRYICGGTCRLEGNYVDGRWLPVCDEEHRTHILDVLVHANRWRYNIPTDVYEKEGVNCLSDDRTSP